MHSSTKGFSHEEKYKIDLDNRETYFVKVCDSSNINENKKNICIETIESYIHIPTPN